MLERLVRLLHSCHAVTQPPDSPVYKRLAGLPSTLRFGSAEAAGRWLGARRTALLAAARTAVTGGELDTLARRYVAALSQALAAHQGDEAAAPEQYRLHELVLDVAGRCGLPRERAAALVGLGDLDARSGRSRAALARYQEALAAAREAGDPEPVARLLESLGATYRELGDWDRAADWYGRALAHRTTRGELVHEARLHGRLGVVHLSAGQWGQALREWRSAAAACRRLGDAVGHARAVGETARVQEYAGRPQEALRTCEQALEYARAAGDVRLRAALQFRIADTLERLGDPVTAALHRGAAGRLLERPATEDTEHAPVADTT
jgi:tetratricopeptide (TPR) repeat protein